MKSNVTASGSWLDGRRGEARLGVEGVRQSRCTYCWRNENGPADGDCGEVCLFVVTLQFRPTRGESLFSELPGSEYRLKDVRRLRL
jgi:hypothetical protein